MSAVNSGMVGWILSEGAGSRSEKGLTSGVEEDVEYALDEVDGVCDDNSDVDEAGIINVDRVSGCAIDGTDTGIDARRILVFLKPWWRKMEGLAISPSLVQPFC